MPVADEAAARAWASGQERDGERGRGRQIRVRVEPARRLAYTRIAKAQVAHPQIIAAFEAVEAWMKREGWEYDGPCLVARVTPVTPAISVKHA